MGTKEDIEKARKGFKTGPSTPQKKGKQPWLKYDLKEENAKRESSRKLLHLTTILKEIGFPVNMCYSVDTLKGMNDKSNIEVPENLYPITGIVEMRILSEDAKKEILDFFKERGIKVFQSFDYKYTDTNEVTRFVVQTSTIKEVG